MWSVRTITQPSALPVTAFEIADHLREDTDNAPLLQTYVEGVTSMIEGWLSRRLCVQTVEETIDCFPFGVIPLHVYPISAISSVKYDDTDNVEQTLAASAYYAHMTRLPPLLEPVNSWPSTKAKLSSVRIQMTVGESPANIENDIKLAIKLMCGHFNQNREAVLAGVSFSEAPLAVRSLLSRHRLYAPVY